MKSFRETFSNIQLSHDNRMGFTLIEVLVALAILSIGMLAITALQASATKSNGTARVITEASTLAAREMERLLALPYTHGDLGNTNPDGGLGAIGDAADGSYVEGIYTCYRNIVDNQALDRSKTIQVVVTCQYLGQDRRIELQRIRVRD